ncbi:carbohydrate ABC transporter permease [Devosia sp. BK]|jgi:lactose/L-arabinose transport system permease protein|uniref:carbohydrate ABC transporter permease n=1 Tax=unclassified Devosia TaxID=196773 RepID=UPI000714DDEB|nr:MULTISPECIES: carbohydrate ABC transporter permease [unclassified Devosia]KQN72338.1 lactose ABC transporter permease [Devosia sp. Leaf64]KQT51873.1 lactose ABC transporter permease [Devosia sp. Leaf420]MDV3251448.1 carbohydrate ABC transporter permease [Devosia sp. BK]
MNPAILRRGLVYALLSLAAFISVFPFYWMIIGATNASADIIRGKTTPGGAFLTNAATFFAQVDAPRIFMNSAIIAIVGTVLTLIISSLAGYGFEMFRSRVREKVFALLLLLLSIPFAAMMVPLFVMFSQAKLVNTFAAAILPTVASIFIIFYFRQATKAFPSELRDAAKIDGLNEWQIFFYVYMPVMRSTYAAATIIVFMANWNNYLWPLIVLQTADNKTITLILSALTSAYTPDYGMLLFGTVLATLPTLIIFFVLQRRFVEGMLGAVK